MYVVEREEANPAHLYIEVLLYFIVKFIVNFHLRSLLLSLILPLSYTLLEVKLARLPLLLFYMTNVVPQQPLLL